jgi:hypothetical protein
MGLGIKSMQAGQAFHANYATSYGLTKDFRVRLNGYWLQQLTDHQINGQDVPNSKERTVGLGPGVQFGGDSLWFRVNSYFETDVRNRPEGIRVTFRISKTLPIRRFEERNHRRRDFRDPLLDSRFRTAAEEMAQCMHATRSV